MSLNVPGGGVQKKLTAEGQHQTEQSAHALSQASTGELFNELLARINFDGMDPRSFSLAELQSAIDGAEWPK